MHGSSWRLAKKLWGTPEDAGRPLGAGKRGSGLRKSVVALDG